jgi:hypothetical protein
MPPISIEGHKAEWKNAQKKPKKSIISDAIKNKKPVFKPFLTTLVCKPFITASRDISKNQKVDVNDNNNNPSNNI